MSSIRAVEDEAVEDERSRGRTSKHSGGTVVLEMVEVKTNGASTNPSSNGSNGNLNGTRSHDDEERTDTVDRPAQVQQQVQHEALSMAQVMTHPSFIPCAVLALVFAGCMWVPYIYLPAFQYDALGIPLKEGAQVCLSVCVCVCACMNVCCVCIHLRFSTMLLAYLSRREQGCCLCVSVCVCLCACVNVCCVISRRLLHPSASFTYIHMHI
jgi:hypothetical protein